MARVLAVALCAAACAPSEPTAAIPRIPDPPPIYTRQQLDDRRIADLVAINAALSAYHQRYGRYPATRQGGFADVLTAGEHWIPGLVPEFLPQLPREPRNSNYNFRPQYAYASNGEDFKLMIYSVSEECGPEIERDGVRIDPARTEGGRCWAYGFWTPGRRAW